MLVQAELGSARAACRTSSPCKGELKAQMTANAQARARNEQLAAEVADLREGTEMVEEKARRELGMVRPDELLVVVSRNAKP
ncbi:MAG: septum formation initiator family protein [Burkholderiaceae bacterium]